MAPVERFKEKLQAFTSGRAKTIRGKSERERTTLEEAWITMLDWPNAYAWPFALICFVLGGAVGVFLVGNAEGLGGALLGAAGGTAAFVFVALTLMFVLWAFVTPRKQLKKARKDLRWFLEPRAFVKEIAHDGRGRDILLPASGEPGETILRVLVETHGPEMAGGLLIVDVPEDADIEPCSQEGNPHAHSPDDIQTGNGRRWFATTLDLPGGQTTVQGFNKLTLRQEGELEVVAKVKYEGSPGWIATKETFQVVRGQP